MRKVVYYETDSSSPSTSGSDAPFVTSKRHERKKFSKIPLHYPLISKRTPLLSIPLGKPPVFDGEDYNMWSDKIRHHLTSLHTSIWNVVEFGVQVPFVRDEDYDSDEVAQIRHFNSQATTVTEPPKSLGPPTVVLVQRTSDNPVGAPESLDKFGICFSHLSQERFTRHADITEHRRYRNVEAIT
jgi:hypothetical protein